MRDRLSAPTSPGGAGALRVAIVGLGPKGTFALERLLDHAGRLGDGGRIEIDAFEAHPVAGAGPVYDPRQPSYLRMNFTAEQIDIWGPESSCVPPAERRSFVQWCEHHARPCDPAGYPPRADVGRYLAQGLDTLLANAPPSTRVSVHRGRVDAIHRERSGWALRSGESRGRYDEVLIATGHERSWDGALANDWTGPGRLAAAVFPVDVELSRARVPPGARVAARGFALSFIDAALALSEGRGGGFEAFGDPRLHPYRLRYLPAGDEPRVILPFSRSGRPMLAKPSARGAAETTLGEIARRGRERMHGLESPVDLRRDVLPVVAATARASLLAAGGAPRGHGGLTETLTKWLAGAAGGRRLASRRAAAEELDRSLAVGAGLQPPDLAWALGHTWRVLYPAVVARLSGDGLAVSDWPDFRRLSGELERVSFGPSPTNAAKLLALIDAGYVDLRHVAGGRLGSGGGPTTLRCGQRRDEVDVVLDAVLPGPGVPAGSELLGPLIRDGHVRVATGRRGVEVDFDGSCLGSGGRTSIGLAAIGRPTEDSVIGNDTLNPRLHDLADRWARRVAARAARAAIASHSGASAGDSSAGASDSRAGAPAAVPA